jgi:hypothetical protein
MYRAEMARAYERFLELPVPVVILTLWSVGALLEGLGALELYAIYWHGMFLADVAERLAEVGT